MQARFTWGALGVALVLGSAHCAAPATDPRASTQSQPIANGMDDTTHRNVVGIRINLGLGSATCTGSLILPTLVLTARHCVSPVMAPIVCERYTDAMGTHEPTLAQAPYMTRMFTVTTSQVMDMTATFVPVTRVIIPPNTTGSPLCGNDIAMLELSQPITDVGLVTPRLDVRPVNEETFTAVGYGATNGMGTGSGRRRIRGGLVVRWVGMLRGRNNVLAVTDREWVGDTGTCQGDSGGPAFDEAWQTMGILSRGAAGTCDSPTFTRVDSFSNWIRGQTADIAAAGGFELPTWLRRPDPGTANFGDACSADDQCVMPLSCLVVSGQRRCTDADCSACPTGWMCGVAQGAPACVPDPTAVVDSGVTDSNVATDASGSEGGTTRRGGCSVSAQATGATRSRVGSIAGTIIALAFARSFRRRASRTAGIPDQRGA